MRCRKWLINKALQVIYRMNNSYGIAVFFRTYNTLYSGKFNHLCVANEGCVKCKNEV
jgi:hypothetical protein